MKKLLSDVRPNDNFKIHSDNLTTEYVDKLFSKNLFDYSYKIDRQDAVHVIQMAYVYELALALKRHNIDAKLGLAPCEHPYYHGWQLLIETNDTCGYILPLLARHITWQRIENQDIMTIDDLMSI